MKKWLYRLLALCALLAIVMGWYVSGGYEASGDATAAMQGSVNVGHAHAFVPDEIRGGLIFYPGGLVDHRAYAPLMQALRERDVLTLLVQMPLDLAVLDMKAADGLQALYPQVDQWLIGGHSLGGAMAASYAAGHAEDFDALVLLAAYSTADLTSSGLDVISLYGSEDGVLNREKYAGYRKNLPDDAREIIIEGGNHAGFGDYGTQRGDGSASISPQEQIRRTVSELIKE